MDAAEAFDYIARRRGPSDGRIRHERRADVTSALATEDGMGIGLGIILASTREGRQGEKVAQWFRNLAAARGDFTVEVLDLKHVGLPRYELPMPTKVAEATYTLPAAQQWRDAIGRLDAFVVVTPEYNHGYPSGLKDALDWVYAGWNNKPVGFVSYGGVSGGIRAVQQLRQVAVELQMVPVRDEVNIPFVGRAFGADGLPTDPLPGKRAEALLDGMAWWGAVLKDGRARYPWPKPPQK